MTPPVYSSGVTTSTFMIGSSSLAPALRRPSRMPIRAAISKASTDRVDVVELAVDQRDLEVDHREAGQRAQSITDSMPFSTPGMNSLGTVPPTILLSNEKPSPGSVGSIGA